jgi:hypothetical protein
MEEPPPITNGKFEMVDIYQILARRIPGQHETELWFLTYLYCAIANPYAFVNVRDMFAAMRVVKNLVHFSSTNAISDHMKFLDQWPAFLKGVYVLNRLRIAQGYKRFEQQRNHQANMKESYPELTVDAVGYGAHSRILKTRIRKGRNWFRFADRFGNGIIFFMSINKTVTKIREQECAHNIRYF